jgi:hypothetical protein
MNIIVYYRTRLTEPAYSEHSFAEQHAAVADWMAAHPTTIMADHTESDLSLESRALR